MAKNTTLSLGELKQFYTQQLQYWIAQQRQYEQYVEQCQREIQACRANLHHVEALLGTEAARTTATPAPVRRGKKKRRRRDGPVKVATLQALRNRPGQRLSTKQLLAAIRQDTRKKVSRQAININLGQLENEGKVQKFPAPRGTKARFVYAALPGV